MFKWVKPRFEALSHKHFFSRHSNATVRVLKINEPVNVNISVTLKEIQHPLNVWRVSEIINYSSFGNYYPHYETFKDMRSC